MASVLVTGHRGYIGSGLVKLLQEQSYISKVIGYDLVDGDDILDVAKLTDVLRVNRVQVVIHLAAQSSVPVCNEDVRKAFRVNGLGTHKVLQAMKLANCKYIIYASTSTVYGNSPLVPYVETHSPTPCSVYGYSKLYGEYAIINHFDFQQNAGSYLIYRMFNVVGTSGYHDVDNTPSKGYDKLFGALESGKVTIYGNDYNTRDRTCERDYIGLKDVCEAYLKGIYYLLSDGDRGHPDSHVLNICREEPSSVLDVINAWNYCHHQKKDQNPAYAHCNLLPLVTSTIGPRREGDASRVYGSNGSSGSVLNWAPRYSLDDIIRDIAFDRRF